MVRAPCCEEMGLRKGPWSPEEDKLLVAYIESHGHGNWRLLPKQAGLLRCGKSCRLRWLNYLKPSIKRGNFTEEEEDTIIRLHDHLGNRWSAIAAELPGRTDNEIKNVWNTHLKKRLKPNQVQATKKPKPKVRCGAKMEVMQVGEGAEQAKPEEQMSPVQSYGEMSSSGTISLSATAELCNPATMKEDMTSSSGLQCSDIEVTFWSESLSPDGRRPLLDCKAIAPAASLSGALSTSCWAYCHEDDEMEDWVKVFMETGKFQELPEI